MDVSPEQTGAPQPRAGDRQTAARPRSARKQMKVEIKMMKKYESMGFDNGQLEEIRKGLEKGVDVSQYASVEYDWFQMEEIRLGLEAGLEVSLYAKPEIPFEKMREIRLGLAEGIDLSTCLNLQAGYLRQIREAKRGKVDIIPYIERGYDPDQLEEIRIALEHGIDIDPYLIKEYLGASLREIRLGLEKGLKVSVYAKIHFGWQQMREIRLGLEHRVNVSMYTNELYRWQQMREIRLGLEEGQDVSAFKSLMYSAREMHDIRIGLNNQAAAEPIKEEAVAEPEFDPEELAPSGPDYSVTVSRDYMQAYIDFVSGTHKTRDEILQILADHGVVYGIREDNIEDYLKNKTDSFLAAEGVMPKRGTDGYYEFFFRTELSREPIIREDGSTDYQNTQYFEQVSAGQVIAVYHEAKPGVSGRNVKGRNLPARMGREKSVLIGKGFSVSEDRKTYTAEISGKIDLKRNHITIAPLLITTDVTTSTGNLRFAGSIWVKGNVGSGVVISASEDLLIEGNVEAATLKSGGSMIIKKGVSGAGTALLEAGSEIRGKFFEGATLRAGGSIRANYVMNCDMSSGDQIEVSGAKGSIVGGETMALNGIKATQIGNRANILTHIVIGENHAIREEERLIEMNLRRMQEEIDKLKESCDKFMKKYSPDALASMELYLKVEQAIKIEQAQIEEQMKRKKELELKLKGAHRAGLVVTGTVNVGTEVNLCGLNWRAVNPLHDVTIRLANNEVIVVRN